MTDYVATGGKKHLPGIHGLRAVAALLIVAVHVCVQNKPWLEVPPSLGASLSHMGLGVHLFFVISIFSLLHSYERATEHEGWIIAYGIRRVFRIAPLFYLIIFYNYLNNSSSLKDAIINILFIFNFVPGMHYSAVAAGWTIGVEVPVYLMLPFMILKFRTLVQVTLLTIIGGIISVTARLLLSHISVLGDYVYFALPSNIAVFGLGALAYHLVKVYSLNAFFRRAIVTGSIFSLIALTTIPSGYPLSAPRLDILLWSISFGLLCMWQAIRPSHVLSGRPIQWIGERSYSIYLLHPLIVYQLWYSGIYATIYSVFHYIGAWAYLVCVSLTISLVLPAAAVTYRFVEIPGQRLGALLIRVWVTRKKDAKQENPPIQTQKSLLSLRSG